MLFIFVTRFFTNVTAVFPSILRFYFNNTLESRYAVKCIQMIRDCIQITGTGRLVSLF